MMQPTIRAVSLFAAGLPVCFVLLVWAPGLWPYSFDIGALVLLLTAIDALLVPTPRALSAIIEAPSSAPIGSERTINLRITSRRDRRRLDVDCALDIAGPAATPSNIQIVVEGRAGAGSFMLAPIRRGVIQLQMIWLRWRGPLGLIQCRTRQPLSNRLDILPARRIAHGPALKALTDSAVYGTKQQLHKGEGTEFDTLREHVPGLDSRFIDWKQSARHRMLVSKEFRIERNHQIVLAYDTGHLMLEAIDGLARLDHAIEAGLYLAATALRAGDLVGSFAFDSVVRQYVEPGRGASYYSRLQRAAARLAYQTEETNFTLGLAELNSRLKRRALVILFTEFIDSVMAELLVDSLKRMSNRHVVVFVTLRDPLLASLIEARPENFEVIAEAVVAHDFARDREVVLERISRLGVHCIDVPVGGLSMALLNRYLQIKQEGLL